MKSRILTIGYEGREFDEFVSLIKDNAITRIIDVREKPLSRKKGFSKSALSELLQKENISYIHIKDLGSPSSLREKLKKDGDYQYFFRNYLDHLSEKEEAISELVERIEDGVNCLMCFERSYIYCHRSIVVKKLMEYDNYEVNHI